MSMITVNAGTCTKDGFCAAVCPGYLLVAGGEGLPSPIAGAEEFCIRCGHCVSVCPTGSIRHSDLPVEKCRPMARDRRLSLEQCQDFFASRRSIRNYLDRPVPRETISRLIELSSHAPSGHNSRDTGWLVIDDRNELTRLSENVAEWFRWMLSHMPNMAISLKMDRALASWEAGRDVILRGAPALIVAHAAKDNPLAPSTCTIALSHLELAATAANLGCCWAGYFNAAATMFSPMKDALALHPGQQSFGAMMIGFPRYEYCRIPPRKLPSITWR